MLNQVNRLLIIGNGGREHAIGLSLKKSNPDLSIYFISGNAGTGQIGTNIHADISDFNNTLKIIKNNNIDMVFVGPEDPLVEGIIDFLDKNNIPAIGPSKEAAQLEGSKKWAKDFMKKNHIPTAAFQYFKNYDDAKHYIDQLSSYPIVVKYDGLAAGKGVSVCQTQTDAVKAIDDIFLNNKFSHHEDSVLIEEFLIGEEASIFAFTDGDTFLPMLPSQDHKAVYDNDMGPNTGGMGAYCPAPIVTPELFDKISSSIFAPLIQGFKKLNIKYKGVIYAGLMIHKNSINVVEFNVRFGDPETQVVLPLLITNLLDIFLAIHHKTLHEISLSWKQKSAICVVLAAEGYPLSYKKNLPITGIDQIKNNELTHIIHAGTTLSDDGEIVSNGGRVLAVVSIHQSLISAIENCYELLKTIFFKGMHFRKDIGKKAL